MLLKIKDNFMMEGKNVWPYKKSYTKSKNVLIFVFEDAEFAPEPSLVSQTFLNGFSPPAYGRENLADGLKNCESQRSLRVPHLL